VQLAATPPATTSTGAFGKYDFMKAKTAGDYSRWPPSSAQSGWALRPGSPGGG
jgi:hypothetical protein